MSIYRRFVADLSSVDLIKIIEARLQIFFVYGRMQAFRELSYRQGLYDLVDVPVIQPPPMTRSFT